MTKRVYVGSLPYATTDQKLEEIFSRYGTVASARVILDRLTGRSKGFGFVEMSSIDEAQAAIEALNGSRLDGRTLSVNEARPPERRPSFEVEHRGYDRGENWRSERGERRRW
jgi:RNA recognition motif-containing protein